MVWQVECESFRLPKLWLRVVGAFGAKRHVFTEMARILVIDDEPAIRELLEKALTAVGHEVTQAADGEEGVIKFLQAPFDLAIVDLYMPGREGMETIRDLRKRSPKLPIIAMSGMSLADDMLQVATLLGAKVALKKPFSTTELTAAVEKVLKP